MKEFSSQVTDVTLARAKLFIRGQQDRRAGLSAHQNDGAYLNGWYAPDNPVPPMFSDEDWEVARELPEFVELLGESSQRVDSMIAKLLEGDLG